VGTISAAKSAAEVLGETFMINTFGGAELVPTCPRLTDQARRLLSIVLNYLVIMIDYNSGRKSVYFPIL
jgi:hypothetical protein